MFYTKRKRRIHFTLLSSRKKGIHLLCPVEWKLFSMSLEYTTVSTLFFSLSFSFPSFLFLFLDLLSCRLFTKQDKGKRFTRSISSTSSSSSSYFGDVQSKAKGNASISVKTSGAKKLPQESCEGSIVPPGNISTPVSASTFHPLVSIFQYYFIILFLFNETSTSIHTQNDTK